ncbi:MAG: DinB family protein [Anaerolineae bacterium]|nr:DinB family protein [Anaerolineae bacterium]
MNTDLALRKHVIALLDGRQAAMFFDDAVANFPMTAINTYPPNVPYTPWHILEHLRITQWDILEYVRNPQHVSPDWPAGYWPPQTAQTDPVGWNNTIAQFREDFQAMRNIVLDPAADLFAPIPHGYNGHTILREALLVADHNAYHIGEFAILRQVMNTWG